MKNEIEICSNMRKIISVLLLSIISLNALTQEVSFSNADGFFSIGTQSNHTASITLSDIDKDGDLDALVANGRHWAEQNYIYYNDGKGGFKLAQPIGGYLDASYKLQSADFNNDGFMDIAIANDSRIDDKIYFGNAESSFSNGIPFGSKSPSRNMDVADIDQDGDIDIILSNRKAPNEICLNDGHGNFDQTITFGEETAQTIQTQVVDINNDGFLDLVTAERKSPNEIYINDGLQNFSKIIEFGSSEDGTRSIAIGDMNNDGYLDIVCGNLNTENQIFYGNEGMSFKEHFSFSTSRETSTIQVADLNQDGHLDVIEGNFEERNYVYLGSKSGDFEEVVLRADLADDTYNIEIGDIDNNGFPDIIVANSDAWNLYYKTREE